MLFAILFKLPRKKDPQTSGDMDTHTPSSPIRHGSSRQDLLALLASLPGQETDQTTEAGRPEKSSEQGPIVQPHCHVSRSKVGCSHQWI